VRTRFKPGVSGNPKGRPKGSKSLRKELENELAELIAIDGADKRKKIPLRRLILKQLVRLAAKGDLKGIAMVLKEVGGAEEEAAASAAEPSPILQQEDELVMKSLAKRIRAMEEPPSAPPDTPEVPEDPEDPSNQPKE